jgi:hypothetical protein
MTAPRKTPSLTIVAGTDGPAEGPYSNAARIGDVAAKLQGVRKEKARQKKRARAPAAADREAKAIELGRTLEALLPAYAELHRAWAKGSREAHAFVDANFAPATTLETSGADLAQEGMNALYRRMSRLAETIARAPTASLEGMRAKSLAAMFECVPGIGSHSGFDFEDGSPAYEMLFRACLGVTGLSKLAAEIEARLQIDADIPQEVQSREETS